MSGVGGFGETVTVATSVVDMSDAPLTKWTATVATSSVDVPMNGMTTAVVTLNVPSQNEALTAKLKVNVELGQAEPGTYATVYDRTLRDQGKNQLYGQQLECASGKVLEVAPIDNEKTVNIRRAVLGLIRIELYARLVRLHSPDFCGPASSQK